MRSKELSEDYRYFPDPDLLPLHISSAFVQAVRDNLPELPDARCQRYQEEMGPHLLLIALTARIWQLRQIVAHGLDKG